MMNLQELVKWPRNAEDMTVDLLLRVIGFDTQLEYLAKMKEMDANGTEGLASPLYHARTMSIISSVGLMLCLRELRETDPARAKKFAEDYWTLCDSGDSFGEVLWDFSQDAGLDLSLVGALPPEAAGS